MRKINASKFEEQCLSLLENLGPEGILITKHGKPLARLVPVGPDCAGLIGSMKDKIKIPGNILSTGIEWETSPALGQPQRKPHSRKTQLQGR